MIIWILKYDDLVIDVVDQILGVFSSIQKAYEYREVIKSTRPYLRNSDFYTEKWVVDKFEDN